MVFRAFLSRVRRQQYIVGENERETKGKKAGKTAQIVLQVTAGLLLYCGTLSAAGPVVHARLADIYLATTSYDPAGEDAFRLGTLYPDIRYICPIRREDTHEKNVTLQCIRETTDPFIAGMRFHAWVDERRNDFVKEYGIDQAFSTRPLFPTYLKLIEDQILFSHYLWDQWRVVLMTYHPHEKKHCSASTLVKWHAILQIAFSLKPEAIIHLHYQSGQRLLNLTQSDLGVWENNFRNDATTDRAHKYVHNLMNHFDSLLAEDKSP